MKWKIILHNKVNKRLRKLLEKIVLLTRLLAHDLSMFGASPGKQWPNFSKLSGSKYHCHLVKGMPTYMACQEIQEITDKSKRKMEVFYVGTHGNAPY